MLLAETFHPLISSNSFHINSQKSFVDEFNHSSYVSGFSKEVCVVDQNWRIGQDVQVYDSQKKQYIQGKIIKFKRTRQIHQAMNGQYVSKRMTSIYIEHVSTL